jgi:spermidine synthase
MKMRMVRGGKTSEGGRDRLRMGFGVIFICFFLSGATGLIYEVLWLRMLGLIFGHTVYAITTVLSAFMAGLALGSLLFGRRAARIRYLIRTYGYLEIGIGVYCALIPVLLWLTSYIYLGLHRALSLSYDAFSIIQFLLIFSLLLMPTTLMGGTLPILSQALGKQETGLGRKVGALYATNTFGAVLGVVLAGYFLRPALGNRTTVAVAALANITVGVLAITYSRSQRPSEVETIQPMAGPPPSSDATGGLAPATPDLGAWLTVVALGLSGAVSMLYEVAWTRALALVIGSSTYAFSAMLVAFLVGIAAGSALYSWLWGTRRASPSTFALIQIGIGAATTAVLLAFERMPEVVLMALRWSDSPPFVQFVQFVVSASALSLSTLLIGATFPCAIAVAARAGARVGRDVGQVYAVNTLGAIAGAVGAGFLLIPERGSMPRHDRPELADDPTLQDGRPSESHARQPGRAGAARGQVRDRRGLPPPEHDGGRFGPLPTGASA